MALSAIWIAVASLIAAFDISKPVDENGNIIDVDPEYDCGTLLRYVIFPGDCCDDVVNPMFEVTKTVRLLNKAQVRKA